MLIVLQPQVLDLQSPFLRVRLRLKLSEEKYRIAIIDVRFVSCLRLTQGRAAQSGSTEAPELSGTCLSEPLVVGFKDLSSSYLHNTGYLHLLIYRCSAYSVSFSPRCVVQNSWFTRPFSTLAKTLHNESQYNYHGK